MAVVGAGITGLAVARELRERGVEALVLERSGVGAGASGVQPGGVRQQWGTRVNCLLARDSLAFLTFATTLGLTIGMCGTVWRLTHPQRMVRTSATRPFAGKVH